MNPAVPLVGLVLAGANVGVGHVDVVGNGAFHAELEGGVVHGGDKEPDLFETTGEDALEGVDTFDHVVGQLCGAEGQTNLDQREADGNDLGNEDLPAERVHVHGEAIAGRADSREALHFE